MIIEDVTAQLGLRETRRPEYEAENRAIHALSRALLKVQKAFYQDVVNTAKRLCGAGSAGISVLASDHPVFHWEALAGVYKSFLSGTTPRDLSPYGTCLARRESVLYDRPHRVFKHLKRVSPKILESLVIVVYAGQEPLAIIWIISHSPARHFDSEDARIMESLAGFIGLAVERKRAALSLQQKTARLQNGEASNQAIPSATPDGGQVLAPCGRVIFVNPRALLRSTRELFLNVARHAQFNKAAVALSVRKVQTGTGFDPKIANSRNFLGIYGMHERVLFLGGRLTLKIRSEVTRRSIWKFSSVGN